MERDLTFPSPPDLNRDAPVERDSSVVRASAAEGEVDARAVDATVEDIQRRRKGRSVLLSTIRSARRRLRGGPVEGAAGLGQSEGAVIVARCVSYRPFRRDSDDF